MTYNASRAAALSFAALLACAADAGSWNYFVNAARPVGAREDGRTWATAFRSLDAALDMATFGDTLWVAAGTYRPSKPLWNGGKAGSDPRAETFFIPPGVAVLGGFVGDEWHPGQRDPVANETILEGQFADGSEAEAGQGDEDRRQESAPTGGGGSARVYHVVTVSATGSNWVTRLSGVIIQHGDANQPSGAAGAADASGGGLLILPRQEGDGAALLVLDRVTFRCNRSLDPGAAIGNAGAAVLHLRDCRLEENAASGTVEPPLVDWLTMVRVAMSAISAR